MQVIWYAFVNLLIINVDINIDAILRASKGVYAYFYSLGDKVLG